ncbi:TonB-dependent receptor [Henriciella litoralis]|uniref:TonB-dependent receptor n=1 Tax=Henriciella litoralis TaxID=568102 RepID=UPI000A071A97|nr:TonB-dependent receptor [Henriciella litoralis]
MRYLNFTRSLMISTALVAVSVPAFAQNEPDDKPAATEDAVLTADTILVTARKRPETLMSAPLTVQAVTSEELAKNPASDVRSLTAMLPNVTATSSSTGAQGSFNIRGIGGANAADAGVDQSVAVVIDEIPISRGTAASGAFFDLASIQALPGPQALYFGKNASAGVISFTTARPDFEFGGYVKGGYEFEAEDKYTEGAVSIPLSDTLSIRLAGRFNQSEGWLKNVAAPIVNPVEIEPTFALQPGALDDRLGGRESYAGRISVLYEPNSDFSALLKFQAANVETDGLGATYEAMYCSDGASHTYNLPEPSGDCKLNGRTTVSAMNANLAKYFPFARNGIPYSETESKLGSLQLEYDAGLFSISSVTGYYDASVRGLGNASNAQYMYFPGGNGVSDEQISQEIRLTTEFDGPLNYIVGAYADHQERYADTVGRGLIFGYLPPINETVLPDGADDVLPTALGYWPQHEGETDTYSVFGQVTWDISSKLTLDAGARFTKVEGKNSSRNSYVDPFYNSLGIFVPPTTTVRNEFDEENVSPEATLSYQPNTDTTVYVTYKTGYKPGGISNPAVLLNSVFAQDVVFEKETSSGGEVGIKTRLANGRANVIASIYRYEFDDLQLSQFDSATTSFFIQNAGSAITQGVDLQATAQLTDELSVNGIVNYNDGYFSDYKDAGCYPTQTPEQGCVGGLQDRTDSPLPNAPEWVVMAGASWEKPISANLALGIDVDAKYSDEYSLGAGGSPNAVQDSFTKLNARVRLMARDESWDLALIGRNLTNEYVGLVATNKPGTNNAQDGNAELVMATIDRGRSVAIQLQKRF